MKKQMDLIITDDPVGDVKLALAKELYDRQQVFQKLNAAGHVRIVEDNDPAHIRCQIEDEIFSDERARFPSTETMARLQLAIAAGRSCQNDTQKYYEAATQKYYEAARGLRATGWSRQELEAGIVTNGGQTKTGITAAVMEKWRKVVMKGLRP